MKISYSNIENERLSVNRESYIIPIMETKKLIEVMEYGSTHRVAVLLLILTGARIREITRLTTFDFYQDYVFISLGKNQKGKRKERLPQWFLQELDFYMTHNSFVANRLFPFNSNELLQYFNKYIRQKVGGNWLKKTPYSKGNMVGTEWYYQLKGFRHTYQSLKFVNYYDKYKDAGLSAELVSKDMKHHCRALTVRHYLNPDVDELRRYKGLTMNDLVRQNEQQRLNQFLIY